MIYVVTALYQEAHGFIRELELKKNTAYAVSYTHLTLPTTPYV